MEKVLEKLGEEDAKEFIRLIKKVIFNSVAKAPFRKDSSAKWCLNSGQIQYTVK